MSKVQYDWELIEKDWRTGQFSNRELSDLYGPTHSFIARKAREKGWKKDLIDDYQKELKNQSIKDSTHDEYTLCTLKTDEEIQDDKETIQKAVDVAIKVVREHKSQIKGLRDIYSKLYEKVITAIDEKPDSKERLPSLIGFKNYHESLFDILSKMSGVTANIIKAERQAFNMDAKESDKSKDFKDKSTDELLQIINACKQSGK